VGSNDRYRSIVSEADTNLIRLQCLPSSELAEVLRRCSFDVLPAGTAERLLPVTETIIEHGGIRKVVRQHVVPTTVFRLRITLFG